MYYIKNYTTTEDTTAKSEGWINEELKEILNVV